MVTILESFCRKYLGHAPQWVDPRHCAHMPILYNNPADVGADRIVNAVGAYHRYRSSLVIIDFGTATTFDAISEAGEYLGGAISPGIHIASEALFQKASKLPRVDLFRPPEVVIGKDTAGSIQAGIIFGYAGLVDGMVRRMAREMGGIAQGDCHRWPGAVDEKCGGNHRRGRGDADIGGVAHHQRCTRRIVILPAHA